MHNIAIIGASGAVGRELLSLMEERSFPVQRLRCFASSRSIGESVFFQSCPLPLEILGEHSLDAIDLAFFCAGSAISREWIPRVRCLCIDSSSSFRKTAPLIIPEINPHALSLDQRVIASPNCAATILLMPLFTLHRLYRVKRIVASTYQAASGGGAALLARLKKETLAVLENPHPPPCSSIPYAFNLFPHDSPLHPSGYVEEEIKMAEETRKILEAPDIRMSASCVRVPVLRAHSIAANIEFHYPFSLNEIYNALQQVPGLKIFEDILQNRFPTPHDVTGKDEVYCGRFRIDPSQPNTLEFWSVGDQLRKGAALNAIQIAESIFARTGSQDRRGAPSDPSSSTGGG